MIVHGDNEVQDKEQKLETALNHLFTVEKEYGNALTDFAEAESEYRVQQAREYLKADGTEKARHNTSIDKVERFLRERDSKEAVRDFTREKLKDAQLVVSARQSLLYADVRTNRTVGI